MNNIYNRLKYQIRNFDIEQSEIIIQLTKEFNITKLKAKEYYKQFTDVYRHIQKKKKLKPISEIKYRYNGIGVEILGKDEYKYKVKISGSKNFQQLDRIY